jgi:hypothetical protein
VKSALSRNFLQKTYDFHCWLLCHFTLPLHAPASDILVIHDSNSGRGLLLVNEVLVSKHHAMKTHGGGKVKDPGRLVVMCQ